MKCQLDVAYGSFASISADPCHVRFAPNSDRLAGVPGCLKGANTGREQLQQIFAQRHRPIAAIAPFRCRRLLADGLGLIEVSVALVAAGEDLGL